MFWTIIYISITAAINQPTDAATNLPIACDVGRGDVGRGDVVEGALPICLLHVIYYDY